MVNIDILYRTPAILKSLLLELPDNIVHSNEGGNSWSPFDIVGHLIHGEKTDWIPRAQIILSETGDKQFEPFDRFAQFENSKGKTLDQLLEEFESLRMQNLNILNSMKITEEDFQKTGIHPEFGKVNLHQLISTWVTHDLGHIYQISRVIAHQYKNDVGPWTQYLRILND